MTSDQPPIGESLVERRIREAMEAGEFDNVAGSGEPIADLGRGYEPNWWVRKWLEREGITIDELRTALGKLND